MINLDWRDKRAINEQITDKIKELIVSGILTHNEQLPSVRELSVSLTVNPNTVQKAYKQLEAEGYIYSIKGKGNFVNELDDEYRENQKIPLYNEIITAVKTLCYLGEDKAGIINLINNIYREKEED